MEEESQEIQVQEIAFKIERVLTLIEVLERGPEQEFQIEQRKPVTLSYTISDYLKEIQEKFAKLEDKIAGI